MMAWLVTDGGVSRPCHSRARPQLITAAVGDLDNDGVPEIVTGGFTPMRPSMSNVTLWRRK